MKTVIIGGGAAGASCAARLRRNDEKAQIQILEESNEISIANCGLPYYIGNVIDNEEAIHVSSVDKFKSWFNIDVKLNTKVNSINKEENFVTTENNDVFYYDNLVIATGAKPFVPEFKGLDEGKAFTLRTLYDANKIKTYIEKNKASKALVIGAGFIGIEIAENLCSQGIDTSIVELSDHILSTVDYEVAKVAQNKLKEQGIKVFLNDGVKEFNNNEAILNSGLLIPFDIVIISIGVKPQVQLAIDSNLNVNKGIVVDDNLRTSCKNIYAAGDNIEINDFITKSKSLIPLAGPANRQGRIIADNICGLEEKYKDTQGSSVLKIFDLTLAAVGASEKRLKLTNTPYLKTFIYAKDHASYYPNSKNVLFKLLFNEKGAILGAQAIGTDGVDKRIDVIATIMRLNGSVQNLIDAELCYAPPFNSAKDPVNLLGMNASNILNRKLKPAFIEDLKDGFLIDVRPEVLFKISSIKDAINIPITSIRNRLEEIPHNKKVILFCNTGYTSYIASRILIQYGFDNVYSFCGGMEFYNVFNAKVKTISKQNSDVNKISLKTNNENLKLNVCGMQCPGPLIKVAKTLETLSDNQHLEIEADDEGFYEDIKSYANTSENTILSLTKSDKKIKAILTKGKKEIPIENANKETQGLSLVVFSSDLDKAIAAFIIANGAAASGKKVTMFFTFWGLSVLRKEKSPIKKGFIESMISYLLPKGSNRLTLSKFNFFGIGSKLMKLIMKKKNVESLDYLIQQAKDNGVTFIACSMSMDIMGLKKEELIDGVTIGGVAKYIEQSSKSNTNLFI